MALLLQSPAFDGGGEIPSQYTCDGGDLNPPLVIDGVPEGTMSFGLVMDDPDAPGGTWVHWVVFNIPPETRTIDERMEPEASAGTNSWGRAGYGGPCPPSGTHRYMFKLYALDTVLELQAGATKEDLEQAMAGHIVEQCELIGMYQRQNIEAN